MMKILSIIVLVILFAGCSAEHYESRARIIERRVVGNDQLLIRYSFKAGDATIIDSVRTRNRVIQHDSLTVRYSASDPRKNTLEIE